MITIKQIEYVIGKNIDLPHGENCSTNDAYKMFANARDEFFILFKTELLREKISLLKELSKRSMFYSDMSGKSMLSRQIDGKKIELEYELKQLE